MRPHNEHQNFEFDNEQDIHTSSETYKESGHTLDLDLFYHFMLIMCFYILGEVGELGEVTIQDSSSLSHSRGN